MCLSHPADHVHTRCVTHALLADVCRESVGGFQYKSIEHMNCNNYSNGMATRQSPPAAVAPASGDAAPQVDIAAGTEAEGEIERVLDGFKKCAEIAARLGVDPMIEALCFNLHRYVTCGTCRSLCLLSPAPRR